MAPENEYVLVVDRADNGKWAVRSGVSRVPIAMMNTKQLAIDKALTLLRASQAGGEVHIFLANGQFERVRRVAPPSEDSDVDSAIAPGEILQKINDEGEKVNTGLELVVSGIGFLSVSGLSAAMSPEVSEAASDGWMAVFFATLTWSLGCAFAAILLAKSGLIGWPLAGGISAGFFVALSIARFLGTGVLDIESGLVGDARGLPGPLRGIALFGQVALRTYGPVGTLVGGGVGAWLGYRLSALFPKGFARL